MPHGVAYDSHKGQMSTVIDSFPMDVSPTGRGWQNMRDWTATVYRKEGPPLLDGMEQPVDSARKTSSSLSRGCWNFVSGSHVRLPRLHPARRSHPSLGFRLAAQFPIDLVLLGLGA